MSGERVEEALAHMYYNDPAFAAAVQTLLPNIDQLQEQVRGVAAAAPVCVQSSALGWVRALPRSHLALCKRSALCI